MWACREGDTGGGGVGDSRGFVPQSRDPRRNGDNVSGGVDVGLSRARQSSCVPSPRHARGAEWFESAVSRSSRPRARRGAHHPGPVEGPVETARPRLPLREPRPPTSSSSCLDERYSDSRAGPCRNKWECRAKSFPGRRRIARPPEYPPISQRREGRISGFLRFRASRRYDKIRAA